MGQADQFIDALAADMPANGASPDAVELIDVPFEEPVFAPGLRLLKRILFLEVALGAAALAAIYFGNPAGIVSGFAFFIALGLGAALVFRTTRAVGDATGEMSGERVLRSEPDIRSAVLTILNSMQRVFDAQPLYKLVDAILSMGRAGTTIRIAPGALLTPVTPIADTFEPRPVDEAEPSFRDIADATGESDEASESPPVGFRPVHRESIAKIRSSFRSWGEVCGGIVSLLVPLQFLHCSEYAKPELRQTIDAGIFGLTIVIVLVGFLIGGPKIRRLYAVPGGLLIQDGRLLSKRRKLTVLTPAKSVMAVYLSTKRSWGMRVTDGETTCEVSLSRAEVEVLLRAWLSPLPPPTAEQLSDLQ